MCFIDVSVSFGVLQIFLRFIFCFGFTARQGYFIYFEPKHLYIHPKKTQYKTKRRAITIIIKSCDRVTVFEPITFSRFTLSVCSIQFSRTLQEICSGRTVDGWTDEQMDTRTDKETTISHHSVSIKMNFGNGNICSIQLVCFNCQHRK